MYQLDTSGEYVENDGTEQVACPDGDRRHRLDAACASAVRGRRADRVKAVRDLGLRSRDGAQRGPPYWAARLTPARIRAGRRRRDPVVGRKAARWHARIGGHPPGASAPRPAARRPRRAAAPPKRRFFDYPRSGYEGLHRWLPSWRFVLGTILAVGFLGAGAVVAAYANTTIPDPADDTKAQTTTVYYANNADGSPGAVMGTFAAQKRTDRRLRHAARVRRPGRRRRRGQDVLHQQQRHLDHRHGPRAAQQPARRRDAGWVDPHAAVRRAVLRRQDDDRLRRQVQGDAPGDQDRPGRSPSPRSWSGYLNTIYFGRDSYGIQAAAQAYFGVDAADLTVEQAALLAGIIPSPNNWDPADEPREGRGALEHRARLHGGGGLAHRRRARADGLPADDRATSGPNTMARHQRLPARDGARRARARRRSSSPTTRSTAGGLTVVTTIQQPLQAAAVDQVDAFLRRHARRAGRRGARTRAPACRSARSTRKDGAIVALYGGAGLPRPTRRTPSPTTTSRPGSTFKPFTLIAALEQGVAPRPRGSTATSPQDVRLGRSETVNNFGSESVRQHRPGRGDRGVGEHRLRPAQPAGRPGEDGRGRGEARRASPTPVDTNRRQRARHRRPCSPIDMAGAYATIASRRHPGRPVHRPRRSPTRDGLGRVRAHGPDGAGVRAGRDRRRDLRDDPGGREGLRQDVDQAARPPDRRQDRDDAGQQVGLVRRLHPEHRHRGVAQPDRRGRQGAGDHHAVRQAESGDAQGRHRRHLAGVPVGSRT